MTTDTTELIQSETTSDPSTRVYPWVLTGPILVATDGGETSNASLRVAGAIARDHGLSVHVISVLEPLASMYAPVDGMMLTLPPQINDVTRTELRWREVHDHVRVLEMGLDVVAGQVEAVHDENGMSIHRRSFAVLGAARALM